MTDEFTLVPRGMVPQVLWGFWLTRSAEILECYGGFHLTPSDGGALTKERIHQDIMRMHLEKPSAFERFHCAPYTSVETYLEVVYYVLSTVDGYLQASHHREIYLAHRPAAQNHLYAMICGVFGFDIAKAKEIDANLASRAQYYVPDPVRARKLFGQVMQRRVQGSSDIFAIAAHTYAFAACEEVFGRMLVYERKSRVLWAAVCIRCGAPITAAGLRPPDWVACTTCKTRFKIGPVYG